MASSVDLLALHANWCGSKLGGLDQPLKPLSDHWCKCHWAVVR